MKRRIVALCSVVVIVVAAVAPAAFADPSPSGAQGAGQAPKHVPASTPGNS